MIEPHKEIVNGCEFWMLPVEGGTFLMGSHEDDAEAFFTEWPQHEVAVSDFHIGRFPVTQAVWKAVMKGQNPSSFQGDDRPVERVSWNDAQAFLKELNELTQFNRPKDQAYRLPSEAEWEFAARGGKYYSEGYKYAGSDRLKDVGWFDENSGEETKPVGLKYPNQLGIYDMSGNVWEWCEDDGHDNYEGAPKNGSAWVHNLKRDTYRMLRGGGWHAETLRCRVTYRVTYGPNFQDYYLGFRLALAQQ